MNGDATPTNIQWPNYARQTAHQREDDIIITAAFRASQRLQLGGGGSYLCLEKRLQTWEDTGCKETLVDGQQDHSTWCNESNDAVTLFNSKKLTKQYLISCACAKIVSEWRIKIQWWPKYAGTGRHHSVGLAHNLTTDTSWWHAMHRCH